MKLHQLEEKINNSASLDFGEVFGESLDLFKKVWIQGVVFLILNLLLLLPAYLLLYIPILSLGVYGAEMYEGDVDFGIYSTLFAVLLLVFFTFYTLLVTFAVRAAFYKICRKQDLNLQESENYFYFFKRKYLAKILQLSLVVVAIFVVAMFLCMLPIIYVSVPIAFVFIVFAFNPELSFKEIIKVSFAIGNKKWLLSFGLTLVAGFLAQTVGVMLCFVGILATASFAMIPNYIIYKKTIGFEEPDTEGRSTNNELFLKK